MYELSALTFLQAREVLLTTDVATLCWDDATTLDATHINDSHLNAITDFDVVADETAMRKSHRLSQPCHGCHQRTGWYVGCIQQKCDYIAVKNYITSKISSTMSDWASINHAVINQLKTVLETVLLELFCNLHHLDVLQITHTATSFNWTGNLEVK